MHLQNYLYARTQHKKLKYKFAVVDQHGGNRIGKVLHLNKIIICINNYLKHSYILPDIARHILRV